MRHIKPIVGQGFTMLDKESPRPRNWEKGLIKRHALYSAKQRNVAFILTDQCPVGCRHCISSSSFTMGSSHVPELRRQLEWIADIGQSGVCDTINLTGGEPFFNFEGLVSVIKAIRDHGMIPTVLTSGFWAQDDDATRIKLNRLISAGLSGIALSVDEFHQERVPLANVARVLSESKSQGLDSVIRFTYMQGDNPYQKLRALKQDLGPDALRNVTVVKGTVIKAGRARDFPWRNPLAGRSPRSHLVCPAIGLSVRQDGSVASCCGAQLPENSPFVLGDLASESFTTIYHRFMKHPLIPFIETWGLADMLDHMEKAGLAADLCSYKRVEEGLICELCQRMFSNRDYVDFFVERFRDPAVKRQIAVMKLMMYGDLRFFVVSGA